MHGSSIRHGDLPYFAKATKGNLRFAGNINVSFKVHLLALLRKSLTICFEESRPCQPKLVRARVGVPYVTILELLILKMKLTL